MRRLHDRQRLSVVGRYHTCLDGTGIGVLYGKEVWLDRLPPYQGGGEMIATVSFEQTTFQELPYKFEAGTPDYVATHGLATAIDWRNYDNGNGNDNGNDSIPAGGGVIVTLNSLRPGAAAGVLGGEEGNTGGAVDDNPPVPDGALNGLEGYSFAYDALSRLTAADYHRNDSRSNDYDTRYTYDSMGNILTLKRRGMMEKPDTAAHTPATYADIDDLTFDYDGNQIVKVTDAVDDGPYYQGAWHYRDNADAQQERFYDGNGNLTKDLDAKISDIQYNSLNLPIMITFTDGSTTRYTYDATGRKLRTEHRVMTTGVFNPGLDDGGEAVPDTGGIALPFPDNPGLAVGECDNLGVTYMPTKSVSSKVSATNPDAVHINMNPSLSSVNGAAEVYSHEANGHALLYIRNGRDVKGASHQPKNGLFEGGETNVELREMIIRSKKETIVNMQ